MPKILVVEDDKLINANIVELLQMNDYDARGACNGKTGIRLLQEFQPDIVLCDQMMDEVDGMGVLQFVRSQPQTSSIPFIFLTAMADRDAIREGMSAGADDYVVKPFNASELLETINVWLDYRRSLRIPS
jgi:DNA-binding response OmpR family regulator